MEVSVSAAINVSILAMSVIFTVLIILIFTIKTLVKYMPYKAAPTELAARVVSVGNSAGEDDQVAAITATLAAHIGKRPDQFRITNIQMH
jgi:Na+-transporting methylmalonyl-CoA/oxaloacetate decarboxylase gamma subunit